MKTMKKALSLLLLLALALVLLTGCSGKGFDGSWNCVEANVPTYGMLNNADVALIERSGAVSTMCVIDIKGTDIKYSESGTSYKVSSVSRGDSEITFKATHNISGTDTVTLRLSSDGKRLTAKRYTSTFVLERSDFWNSVVVKFFTDIPVWLYILVGVLLVGAVLYKVFTLKKEAKLRDQGKLVYRDKDFYRNAEIFTLGPVEPGKVTEGIKAFLPEFRLAVNGNTARTVTFKGNAASPWSADLTRVSSDEEKTVYRFEFTGWKSSGRSGKPDDELAMNMLETAVEKMFVTLDPNTKVHTEPVTFHSTEE